jgi:hypothetical protein
MAFRTGVWAAAFVLTAAFGTASQAGQGGSLRDLFASARPGRAAQAPPVARFVADDRAFVLDRSGDTPLLKFEGEQEVWALRAMPGPRGDIIYKDDLGRPVLRATRLGGVTVFTSDRPSGLPAAVSGAASAIRPAAFTAVQLWRHLVRQSSRVSRAIGRRVEFVAEEVDAGEEAIYADAATVTATGLTKAAPLMRAGGPLDHVDTVEFTEGARASAAVRGDSVQITLAPTNGLAGRPSSERVLTTVSLAVD